MNLLNKLMQIILMGTCVVYLLYDIHWMMNN